VKKPLLPNHFTVVIHLFTEYLIAFSTKITIGLHIIIDRVSLQEIVIAFTTNIGYTQ
jgi:hypothetical protein